MLKAERKMGRPKTVGATGTKQGKVIEMGEVGRKGEGTKGGWG